jgi:hypothetical protein
VDNLVAQRLVAIVRFLRSASSAPKLAVMFPQEEVLDSRGCQLLPCGFNLIQLPFNDEVALADAASGEEGAEGDAKEPALAAESVEAAKRVVAALHIDTEPVERAIPSEKFCYYRDVANPALQRFYSILESVATHGEFASDDEADTVKPYYKLEPGSDDEGEGEGGVLTVRRKGAIIKFKDTVGLDDNAVESARVRAQRKPSLSLSSACSQPLAHTHSYLTPLAHSHLPMFICPLTLALAHTPSLPYRTTVP